MSDALVIAIGEALKELKRGGNDETSLVDYLQSMVKVDIDFIERWQKNFQLATASPTVGKLKKNADFGPLILEWEEAGKLTGKGGKAATAIPLLATLCTNMAEAAIHIIPQCGSPQWRNLWALHTRHLHHLFKYRVIATDYDNLKITIAKLDIVDDLEAKKELVDDPEAKKKLAVTISKLKKKLAPLKTELAKLETLKSNAAVPLRNNSDEAMDIIDAMIMITKEGTILDEALKTVEGRICVHHLGSLGQIQSVDRDHASRQVYSYYKKLLPIQEYEEYRENVAPKLSKDLHSVRRDLSYLEHQQEELRQLLKPALPTEPAVLSMAVESSRFVVPLSTSPKAVTYTQNIAFITDITHPAIPMVAAALGIPSFDGGVFANNGLSVLDEGGYSVSRFLFGTVTEKKKNILFVDTDDFVRSIPLPLHDCELALSRSHFYTGFNLCLMTQSGVVTGVFLYNNFSAIKNPEFAQRARSTRAEFARRIELLQKTIAYLEYKPASDYGASLLTRVNPLTGQHDLKDMSLRPILDARAQNIRAAQEIIRSATVKIGHLTRELEVLIEEQPELNYLKKTYHELNFAEIVTKKEKNKGKKIKGTKEYEYEYRYTSALVKKVTGANALAFMIEKYLPDQLQEKRRLIADTQEAIEFYNQPIFEDLPWESAAATYSALLKMRKYIVSVEDNAKYRASLRYLSDNWDDFDFPA
jgi:hypothetical protein